MQEEDLEALLEADYEYGVTLKEQILPNAVLYFTGEATTMSGEDEGSFDDGEDADESGEYNSEVLSCHTISSFADQEDEDFVPDTKNPPAQPECKQQ